MSRISTIAALVPLIVASGIACTQSSQATDGAGAATNAVWNPAVVCATTGGTTVSKPYCTCKTTDSAPAGSTPGQATYTGSSCGRETPPSADETPLCCADSAYPSSGSCECTYTGAKWACSGYVTNPQSSKSEGNVTCGYGQPSQVSASDLMAANLSCCAFPGNQTCGCLNEAYCNYGTPVDDDCLSPPAGFSAPPTQCPAGKTTVSACSDQSPSTGGGTGSGGSGGSGTDTSDSGVPSGSVDSGAGNMCVATGGYCVDDSQCCDDFCNPGSTQCGCSKAGYSYLNGGGCTTNEGCCSGVCVVASGNRTGYCCEQQLIGGVEFGLPPGASCTSDGSCCSGVCNSVYHYCY